MDFLKKLGIYKLVLFSLSTLAVLIALVYFVISLSKPIYSPLYNDLTQQDQNIVTLSFKVWVLIIKLVQKILKF